MPYKRPKEKKIKKKDRDLLDNKEMDAKKRGTKAAVKKTITIETILNATNDAYAEDYKKKNKFKGKVVISDKMILDSEQQQIMLTQIALGIAKDGLSGLSASNGEKMKAIELLAKIQANEVGGDVIAEHNESIRQLEIKNTNSEAPQRKLEDFE